jgi:Fic family protein
MDTSEFKAKRAGRVVTGPEGYAAFVPAPLPRTLRFTSELVVALSRADAALGALSGLAGELPEPTALAAPFLRREALCNSRIEGLDVTLPEMLLHEISAAPVGSRLDYLDDVRNALAALMDGLEAVDRRPLDLALVRKLHERLLRGEPVAARTPGEFRTTQNWIGPPGSTLADAVYVPPPVRQMHARLADLECFLAERDRLPDLVQCAMAHAQFQSIHPFIGGNGRLGRILIAVFLAERGRLAQPLLCLSAYLEAHRQQYYTLLQRVRTKGEWQPWLVFFLDGVRETAERAHTQARTLVRQHDRYRELGGEKLHDLVDELFVSPFVSVAEARRMMWTSDAVARRAVARLEHLGLLVPVPESSRPRLWVAPSILDAIIEPIVASVERVDGMPEGQPQKSWLGWDIRPRRLNDRLMREAMAMVDAARAAGVAVRLAGGLAVRRHVVDLTFMERTYSDVDLVGLSSQREELIRVLQGLGYVENRFVSQATEGRQLQFVRREAVRAASAPEEEASEEEAPAEQAPDEVGASDEAADASPYETPVWAPYEAAPDEVSVPSRPLVHHVDVFLDVMRMDHDIDIRERLEADEYALSPVDALVAKAQIGRINEKDVHDIIALFKDLPVRDVDDGLSIYAPKIAELCADDWGLYTDVTTNLRIVLDWAGDFGLSAQEVAAVRDGVTAVLEAIEDEEKTRRWHWRARIGKRAAWRREVEGAEGTPVEVAPE